MGRYTIRRLLQFIPVLLGTMFLLHYLQTLSFQISGNPIRSLFGDRQPPPETIATLTRSFGLDDPCLNHTGNPCLGMFFERLGNYAHGDFGTDFNRQSTLDLIGRAAPITLRLTALAIVFESLVGIVAGVLAGLRKDSFADNFVRVSTVLLISVPVFVFGVLMQILSGLYIGKWVKDRGAPDWVEAMFSVTYRPDHPWASLVVPAIVLGGLSLGFIARLTRTSLIETLRSDYVRTARAKGLQQRRIVGIHALRNSLIPVVTYIGIDIGTLMAGALVTEGIFNIPGIGGLTFVSVRGGQTPVVIAVATLLTLVFLVASLFVDLLYAVLDPRIRYE
ncbi:ABC transporter permease [Nocardioides marmoribigeumensis]|uniref:Peptide/nickel transport system permease protein/oligopeptide transport system permease protein n=1 Tax=Nocardioides marmoribigeumensis TaxID=433649 RepID=A0ABU2BQX1_9ACTN|nr:ABC transporter permease [Nocardioides marmoribigeumensis]MDR7361020.1 peptide/nickel transport system permease protein/oligopeptide transport system permease protein [Nocardioides marmoribigeumensis]